MQPTPSRRQWLSGITAVVAAWLWHRKTKAAESPSLISTKPVTFQPAMPCSLITTYTYDASSPLITMPEHVTTFSYYAPREE